MRALRSILWISVVLAFTVPMVSKASIIVGWGENGSGEANPPAGVSNAVAVAAGGYSSIALRSTGMVLLWGSGSYGLGTPPAGLADVTRVTLGSNHALAVKSDGTVVAWGGNGYGQTNLPAGLSGVIAVAGGDSHSLALKSDGTVVGWGRNYEGQSTPPAGLSDATAIAACASHSLALRSDGTVIGWGSSEGGANAPPVDLSDVTAIATGRTFSLALKSNGTVVGWGANDAGQATPPAGLTGVVAIAAGSYHSMALKPDGTVVVWGYNRNGIRTPPFRLSGVTAIAAGDGHCLAAANMQNAAPVANAGLDRAIEATGISTSIFLNGSGSTDDDGDTLKYTWKNATGTVLGTAATYSCQCPLGSYSYTLTVADYYGGSSSDSVTIVVQDTTPPTVSKVTTVPAMAAAGDPVRVEVTASDNVGLTSVQVDGMPLTRDCAVWAGNITASSTPGLHHVSAVASDGLNPSTIDTSGSYTTTRLFGISCKWAASHIMGSASGQWVFKVWGKVKWLDSTRFELSDGVGAGVVVKVIGNTGLTNGNYASARGTLDTTTVPPTLTSIPALVQKL